ncbi:MAG: glycosyltransferase family 4 protein [Hyphomicrobium sp.]
MRIAFVSSEYAGTTAGGGIGTYVRNAARMLATRGHAIEVFAGAERDQSFTESWGVFVNFVGISERGEFAARIAPVFLASHRRNPFDVIEGAEYQCETCGISKVAPDAPLVLKLHTPSSLIHAIDYDQLPVMPKVRYFAGGLLRGHLSKPYWKYAPNTDNESANCRKADEITAPCQAIADLLAEKWAIPRSRITVVSNVFMAPPALLSVPPCTSTSRITFIGRLEYRKGVTDLAEAIPLILRRRPDSRFRLIGRSIRHPHTGEQLLDVLKQRLANHQANVEFIGSVPYDEVPAYYADTDICVFPSIWENFPNVCLEAMAAARGVIGSSAGGMAEIIEHGRTGLLVPPRDPKAIASAILELLQNSERRIAMGRAAREHVTKAYAPEVIAPLQEASYRRAIANAAKRSERSEIVGT